MAYSPQKTTKLPRNYRQERPIFRIDELFRLRHLDLRRISHVDGYGSCCSACFADFTLYCGNGWLGWVWIWWEWGGFCGVWGCFCRQHYFFNISFLVVFSRVCFVCWVCFVPVYPFFDRSMATCRPMPREAPMIKATGWLEDMIVVYLSW